MNSSLTQRLTVALLCVGLTPLGCNDAPMTGSSSEASPVSSPSAGDGGGDDVLAEIDAEIEAQDIPSQDAVDAAAAEAIDESNADDEFAKLQAEIDADG